MEYTGKLWNYLHCTSCSIYILDTYNKHGFCLLTGLCGCWFPIWMFAYHSYFYGWLPSELVHVSSWGSTVRFVLLHLLSNMNAHNLAILGSWVSFYHLFSWILMDLCCLLLSFFSFIWIGWLSILMDKFDFSYVRPLVGIKLFMDIIVLNCLTSFYFYSCCDKNLAASLGVLIM